MKQLFFLILLLVLSSTSVFSQSGIFRFGVTEYNSTQITMNDTISVQKGIRFSMGTKIHFPRVNAFVYIDVEVLYSFTYADKTYRAGESIRFTNDIEDDITPLWWIKKNRTAGKGTSFSETYEEYVDYLINDTLVITAFQNIIDDAHSYYLVAIIDDDIVKIPMKVYPSNDKWCYITRKELNQYGIQQQDGRYFFIGLEYGDLIVINYLTVIDDDILN